MDNLRLWKVKQFFKVRKGHFHTATVTCVTETKSSRHSLRRALLKWRCSTWLTAEKHGPGQNSLQKLAYMPRFTRWLTIFYSTWNWKQRSRGKNRNEVTDLLFIGYQPPHSAAFQLRWILNVIFFLQLHTEKLFSEKEIIEFNNISGDMVICFVTVSARFTTYSSGLIDHK